MRKPEQTLDAYFDVDLDDTVIHEIDEETARKVAAACEESNRRQVAGEHIADDDCPVCKVLAAAGYPTLGVFAAPANIPMPAPRPFVARRRRVKRGHAIRLLQPKKNRPVS